MSRCSRRHSDPPPRPSRFHMCRISETFDSASATISKFMHSAGKEFFCLRACPFSEAVLGMSSPCLWPSDCAFSFSMLSLIERHLSNSQLAKTTDGPGRFARFAPQLTQTVVRLFRSRLKFISSFVCFFAGALWYPSFFDRLRRIKYIWMINTLDLTSGAASDNERSVRSPTLSPRMDTFSAA